jgi:DNA-binding IclR family transcriptional regulator
MSQTVERAIAIVELLSQRPQSLAEVTEHLEVHKSTALRLLQTLEAAGFARRADLGAWTVGTRLIGIAQQSLDSLDLRAVAAPHIRRLAQACGHTVHLAQLIDHEVIYIDKVEGRDRVRMYSGVGKTVSLFASGVGKAILAYLEEPLQHEILSGIVFQAYTSTTITTPTELQAELALIRQRGWACDNGEFEDYIGCVAAPVKDSDGRVRAGISVTTLQAIAPIDKLQELIPEVLRTTEDISRASGWSGG